MRKIGFVVDSTFGYKGSEATVVPLNVFIDDKEYVDGEFDGSLVVEALEKDLKMSTSQPSPNAFLNAYEKELAKGYEHVICLTIASSLSGTFNSANLGKDILENDNVTIIDTKTVNLGSEYILEEAIKYANLGKSLEEVIEYINDLISKGSIIFSVDNLQTLVKGGRLGRFSALIGSVLKIKPILRFKEGILNVEAKVRGLMGVFKYITNQVLELLTGEKVVVRITYVDNKGYAENLERMINDLNDNNLDLNITGQLNASVAAHIGLGGMGIYLIKL